MAIRLRTKKLIYAGVIGASISLVLCGSAGAYLYIQMEKDKTTAINRYKAEMEKMEQWAAQNAIGFSLKEDIPAGTKITEDMLQQVVLPPAAVTTDIVFDKDAIGRYTKIDLKANSVLYDSLLYEDEVTSNDLRKVEYNFITLPQKLKKGQVVDIRIQFPNGDDYIVLSKKKVKDLQGDTIWIELNEEEILTMSSAMVDAYLEDARIYALTYVDQHLQTKAKVTYPVKPNVLTLIEESPNIVNIAAATLNSRNRTQLEQNLKQMNEQQKKKVIDTQLQNQYKAEQQNATQSQTSLENNKLNQEDIFNQAPSYVNEGGNGN